MGTGASHTKGGFGAAVHLKGAILPKVETISFLEFRQRGEKISTLDQIANLD